MPRRQGEEKRLKGHCICCVHTALLKLRSLAWRFGECECKPEAPQLETGACERDDGTRLEALTLKS